MCPEKRTPRVRALPFKLTLAQGQGIPRTFVLTSTKPQNDFSPQVFTRDMLVAIQAKKENLPPFRGFPSRSFPLFQSNKSLCRETNPTSLARCRKNLKTARRLSERLHSRRKKQSSLMLMSRLTLKSSASCPSEQPLSTKTNYTRLSAAATKSFC